MFGRQIDTKEWANAEAVAAKMAWEKQCHMKERAAGSATLSDRRPELSEYMERLAGAISMNEELAAHVTKRLDGVLRPNSPQPETCGQAAVGPSTYYGQQLLAAIERIAGVNGRLQDVLQRLEA
jgi:hypothetical protein